MVAMWTSLWTLSGTRATQDVHLNVYGELYTMRIALGERLLFLGGYIQPLFAMWPSVRKLIQYS